MRIPITETLRRAIMIPVDFSHYIGDVSDATKIMMMALVAIIMIQQVIIKKCSEKDIYK